jgi:uncharacterized protein
MGARNRPEMPYGWGRVPYSLKDRLPWMNLPFDVSEYHQRIERLRGHMSQNRLDALAVVGNRADNSNVRYLSNFEDFYGGESIVVVPAVGQPGFTTNAIMHGEPMHSGAYRPSILTVREFSVTGFFLLSLIGGLIGALLLLSTPTAIFAGLVPWLILFATIVFAIGNFAPLEAIQRIQLGPRNALVTLFILAIYGGYFGGGIGFLMLAAFTLFGMRDINTMNGLKMALVGMMTIAAIAAFIVANVVRWPLTLPMLVSSAVGSYVAARWAQRLDQRLIKGFVVMLGTTLTIYFLWRGA